MDKGTLSISITPGTLLVAVAIGLLAWLLYFLRDLVLVVLTAIVLASAVEPGVQYFMRYRAPRVLGVALVYSLSFIVLFGMAYFFFPPLLKESQSFTASLPTYLNTLEIAGFSTTDILAGAKEAVVFPSISDTISQLQTLFTATGSGAFRALSGIFGGVASFVLVVVLSFYFAAEETGVDDFIRVVTPTKYQKYALDLWRRSHVKIGLWMQGQLLLSLIMGVMAYLWLTILGVPYAMVLALVVAFFELIPFFGPILSGVAATAIAFSSVDPRTALFVAGGFVVLHQLESNLIYPLVIKKVVGVPPLLVILALIAGAQIAGFLGILLSVPIAAALQELVTDIMKSKEQEVGDVA
ncbi:MAG: hypothetical protein RLZZ283_655 [Candidatus Parcubacteria bacterium]